MSDNNNEQPIQPDDGRNDIQCDDDDDDDEEMPPLAGRRPRRTISRPQRYVEDVTWKRQRTGDGDEAKKSEENKEEKHEAIVKVPPSTRSIIENDELSSLIKNHCVCRYCRKLDSIELTFPSVAVSTTPCLKCNNCGRSQISGFAGTSFPAAMKTGRNKVTDFAVNIIYVISFLSSGDGGMEAQRLMGLLGLPHVQSMQKSTFSFIEKAIAPALWSVVNKALDECLVEEVKETTANDPDFDYERWEKAFNEGILLYPDEYPEIHRIPGALVP